MSGVIGCAARGRGASSATRFTGDVFDKAVALAVGADRRERSAVEIKVEGQSHPWLLVSGVAASPPCEYTPLRRPNEWTRMGHGGRRRSTATGGPACVAADGAARVR